MAHSASVGTAAAPTLNTKVVTVTQPEFGSLTCTLMVVRPETPAGGDRRTVVSPLSVGCVTTIPDSGSTARSELVAMTCSAFGITEPATVKNTVRVPPAGTVCGFIVVIVGGVLAGFGQLAPADPGGGAGMLAGEKHPRSEGAPDRSARVFNAGTFVAVWPRR